LNAAALSTHGQHPELVVSMLSVTSPDSWSLSLPVAFSVTKAAQLALLETEITKRQNKTVKRDLSWFLIKSTDSFLGPTNELSSRKAWHLCLHFAPVLCSELFFPAAMLELRKDRMITSLWQGTETSPKKQRSLAGLTTPWRGQLPIPMRLHPGAGVVISWEPDCSPWVMTVITSSLEPFLKPRDWDNGQPEHICLTMHPFVPCPQFFIYLNLQLMSIPRRWLRMSWVFTIASSHGMSWAV
jgi:hypothetical protein